MVDTLPQQTALAGGAGMKTFIVTIMRETRQKIDIEVEAEDASDAEAKAIAEEQDTSDDCWDDGEIIDQKVSRVREVRR